MEALQCKFTQGNDMDDAKRVIAQWNDNADKNFSAPYNAWVLTPLYTSTEDVDFLCLDRLHLKTLHQWDVFKMSGQLQV